MKKYIIIGGGISGLLAGATLKRRNLDFVGLEAKQALGGRLSVGHHRLYETYSTQALSELYPELRWEQTQCRPQQRTKGKFSEVRLELDDCEAFYLRDQSYFEPSESYKEVLNRLVEEVGASFNIEHSVAYILPDSKTVLCQNESRFEYEKLIWCAPIGALSKAWQGDKLNLGKILKKEEDFYGGINFDVEVKASEAPFEGTLVFPFRFKDNHLKAMGTARKIANQDGYLVQWIVFLTSSLLEDREEVAKIVRALKREVGKEFPIIKENSLRESLYYLPAISGETPRKFKTLEILPSVYYLGPQIALAESKSEARNLDRTLENLRSFSEGLSQ